MVKKRSLTILLLTFLVCTSGCATKWVKLGATEHEFNAMKASCEARAQSKFPPLMRQQQISSGYTTPMTTNCYNTGYQVQCYSTGGHYVPPRYMAVDDNYHARQSDIESCYYENGWRPEESD